MVVGISAHVIGIILSNGFQILFTFNFFFFLYSKTELKKAINKAIMANPRSQRNHGNTGTDKESKSKSSSSRSSKAAQAAAAAEAHDYNASTTHSANASSTNGPAGSGAAGSNSNSTGNNLSNSSANTKDLVDLESLPVETLRKYRQVHKLSASIPSALSHDGYLLNSAVGRKSYTAKHTSRVTKHELATVVKKHFAQQNVRESEVIVDFIYSVNRQGEYKIGLVNLRQKRKLTGINF